MTAYGNGEKAAMPQPLEIDSNGVTIWGGQSGLTKREYYAGLAMQGFCATGHYANGKDMACDALAAADALLAALEEQ